MITRILQIVVLFTGLFLSAECPARSPATPKEWFIFFSDGLEDAYRKDCWREVFNFLGSDATPGDVVNVLSAPKHQLVATFTVPEGSHNTRLRHRSLKEALVKLRPLFTSSGEAHARLALPSLAEAIKKNRSTDYRAMVVAFGSPIYNDPKQGGWSMIDGVVPTDKSIGSSLSPFTLDQKFTDGTLIVIVAPNAEWGVDSIHREHVTHFNRLLIQKQNGSLVRIADNPTKAFAFEPPQFDELEIANDDGFGVRQVSRETYRREGDLQRGRNIVPDVNETSRKTGSENNADHDLIADREKPEVIKPMTEIKPAPARTDTIMVVVRYRSDDPECILSTRLSGIKPPETKKAFDFGGTPSTRQSRMGANETSTDFYDVVALTSPDLSAAKVHLHVHRSIKPVYVDAIRFLSGKSPKEGVKMRRVTIPASSVGTVFSLDIETLTVAART